MNLWLIFLTGLTTGGLSCLAVQGGFLASIIANQKEKELEHPNSETKPSSFDKKDWLPVILFVTAKLISHTILGFGLGLLGSALTLSTGTKLFFQGLAAFFMFATAMNLLNMHPIFRYVMIQPPKFLTKRIRGLSKDGSFFTPFILGFFTIFIPCGVTQAMEVSAVALGNPIQSASLMFAFVLGTAPLFSIIGIAMAKLSEGLMQKFLRLAAILLIGMSLLSLNGVLEVLDAPVTASKMRDGWISFWTPDPVKAQRGQEVVVIGGRQAVTIDIINAGYRPNYIRVKKGVPVDLTLRSNGVYTCALDFHLQAFGLKTFLKAKDQQTLTFVPDRVGRFTYACGMGMYTGVLEVI